MLTQKSLGLSLIVPSRGFQNFGPHQHIVVIAVGEIYLFYYLQILL